MRKNVYTLYCDGGFSKVGAYFSYKLFNPRNRKVWELERFLMQNIPKDELPINCTITNKGKQTNNLAEYAALYYGLFFTLQEQGAVNLEVYQDSKLVVNQVSGLWGVKSPHLVPWRDAIRILAWSKVNLNWVPRNKIVAVLGH